MNIEIILNKKVIKVFDDPAGCRDEAQAWVTAKGYEVTARWVGPRGHLQEWEVAFK